jgi:hypothetical protein
MPLFTAVPVPERQAARLCAFGLAYCALHVGTEFVTFTFPIGLTLGDWITLLCPWLVMGSAWLVWDSTADSGRNQPGLVALLLLSALLYATGYGINLSANAIGRLVDELAHTQPSRLIYFLDEHLGHVLWHAGMIGTTTALILSDRFAGARPLTLRAVLGAIGYSFAYFTEGVEGQTVAMLLPFSVIVVAALARPTPTGRPLCHRYFLLAHALALVQFAVWAAWQGGFPEFSQVWNF